MSHCWCAPVLPLVFSLVTTTAAAADRVDVDTDTAVPVQVVSSADIERLPSCGRMLSDLINVPPAPALNVARTTIKVPAGANTPTLFDNLRIRTSDGREQPASGPICFESLEVLRGPAEVIYGSDAVAGVVHFITPRPAPTLHGPGDPYSSNFFAEPFLNPSQVQRILGPFDGLGAGTSVEVGGKPGLILAETPHSLFWLLPRTCRTGPCR